MRAGKLVRETLIAYPLEQFRSGVGAEAWGIVWRRIRIPVREAVGTPVAAVVSVQVNTGHPPVKAGRWAAALDDHLSDEAFDAVRPLVGVGVWYQTRTRLSTPAITQIATVASLLHSELWWGQKP